MKAIERVRKRLQNDFCNRFFFCLLISFSPWDNDVYNIQEMTWNVASFFLSFLFSLLDCYLKSGWCCGCLSLSSFDSLHSFCTDLEENKAKQSVLLFRSFVLLVRSIFVPQSDKIDFEERRCTARTVRPLPVSQVHHHHHHHHNHRWINISKISNENGLIPAPPPWLQSDLPAYFITVLSVCLPLSHSRLILLNDWLTDCPSPPSPVR